MGRGNVCVRGEYEGLFYIDNDDLRVYRPIKGDKAERKLLRDIPFEDISLWEYSGIDIQWWESDVIEEFQCSMQKRFPSFRPCSEWLDREQKAILENELFYIALENNEWSTAVELIQKEVPWPQDYSGLQRRHFQKYLDGIRNTLFEQFDTLGIYTGPWTSGFIHKTEFTKA